MKLLKRLKAKPPAAPAAGEGGLSEEQRDQQRDQQVEMQPQPGPVCEADEGVEHQLAQGIRPSDQGSAGGEGDQAGKGVESGQEGVRREEYEAGTPLNLQGK